MKQTVSVTMHVTMPMTIENPPNAESSQDDHEAFAKSLRKEFNLLLRQYPMSAWATELVSVHKTK